MEGIQIVGFKKSGKTTLSQLLLNIWQKNNIWADYIKFSHHNFENQSTDTGKFIHEKRNVIGVSQSESMCITRKTWGLLEILSQCKNQRILMEGGKSLSFLPRIVCLKSNEDWLTLDNGLTLATFSLENKFKQGNIPHFTLDTVPELAQYIENKLFLLAGLNCKACHYSTCQELGQEIIQGNKDASSCLALKGEELSLKINNQVVALNPFTQLFIENTINGMLHTLKGLSSGKTEIVFHRK